MHQVTPICPQCHQTIDAELEKKRLLRDLRQATAVIEDLRQAVDSATAGYMRFLRRLEEVDPVFQGELTEEDIPFEKAT